MSFGSMPAAFAAGGVYGTLTGTVVDASTHAPIAGATVVAVSASQRFSGTTDREGRFSIIGVGVDTYTVSITAAGHEVLSVTGVTVLGDQTNTIGTVSLGLRKIGQVTARSIASAFQPSQTSDQYTINPAQIAQSTGKNNSTDENAALLSVPGVTLTNNNSAISTQVTIRGGAAYEVGYQLDGIPFREPFLSGNGSYGLLNGIGSVQVVEGAADATQAGVGSGVINIIPQRGSGSGSGLLDIEGGFPQRNNQYGLSYGFSTPDNRFSEYFSFINQGVQPYYGYASTNKAEFNNYFATEKLTNNQFVNNFFYKFGNNQNQQLQLLYLNITQEGFSGVTDNGVNPATTPGALSYYPYDTLTQTPIAAGFLGYNANEYAQLIALNQGTPAADPSISNPQQLFSNTTQVVKLEYDNNFSDSTYLALRYYNIGSLEHSDSSYSNPAPGTGIDIDATNTVGGYTTGMNADLVHSFSQNLTLTVSGEYDVLHPLFDGQEPQLEAIGLLGLDGDPSAPSAADFLPGGYVYDYFCGATPWNTATAPKPACAPRLPNWGINYQGTDFQNWGIGARIQFNPSNKLHFDLGVRDEGQVQHWKSQIADYGQGIPTTGAVYGAAQGALAGTPVTVLSPFDVANSSWTNNVLQPVELEPRASFSYQFGANDSFRFSYGRSAVFANAQTAGTPFELFGLQKYLNIPAKPGAVCGNAATYQFPCQSYGAQLYWAGDGVEAPDAGNGRPALYSNYDASYSHQFSNGVAVRLTPFYKLGQTLPSDVLINPVLGIFAVGNDGFNRTTGTELDITTRQRAVGLSGFIAATYQNVLTTTTPFTSGENSVPALSTASLALGNLYRAGYISPFSVRIGATENFKSGFSILPQLETNVGYPYTYGNTIAAQLADGSYANVPQVNFGPGITTGTASIIGTAPGSAISTNYYDPSNPGNSNKPNIDATRGTPATTLNGGYLSHGNAKLNVTFQYTFSKKSTLGVQLLNLGGNAYTGTVPVVNPWYQPVANGLSGPQTGVESCGNQVGVGNRGCVAAVPHETYAFANGAYLLTNGNFTSGEPSIGPLQPFAIQLFYQQKL
jgi:hypothetical protein